MQLPRDLRFQGRFVHEPEFAVRIEKRLLPHLVVVAMTPSEWRETILPSFAARPTV